MSSKFKAFFLLLVVNFLVLACLNVLFEYFDTGDDPLYSPKAAGRNLIVAVFIAATTVSLNMKKNRSADKNSS